MDCNINYVDKYNNTALIWSCYNNLDNVALKLLERKDCNIRYSSSSPYGDEIPAVTILKDEITQTKTRLKTFYNKI